MSAGIHSSLSQLGYISDPQGRSINLARVERALLANCEQNLGRSPSKPIEWSPEMPV